MTSNVHLERDCDSAVVVMDNPPPNVGPAAVQDDQHCFAGLCRPGFVAGDTRRQLDREN